MHTRTWIFAATLLLVFSPVAVCDPVEFQWMFNENSLVYDSLDIDGSSVLGSNYTDNRDAFGVGTVEVVITNPGSNFVLGFFDFEFNDGGSPLDDEFGFVNGTPDAGLSWQIGNPFEDPAPSDYIYYNFLDNLLSNSIQYAVPNDVAVALGWNFNLASTDFAKITFVISTVAPAGGFYLRHQQPWYPGNPEITGGYPEQNLYFSSSLTIQPKDIVIPEPATWLLLLAGLGMIGASRRWRYFR